MCPVPLRSHDRRFPALAVAVLAVTGCSSAPRRAPAPESLTPDARAVAAARAFLDHYVDPDGRVVRRDQGSDTVSEGQAYALLAAAALGDAPRFARVWAWTRDHLRRPDGLLGYLWREGRVTDDTPAADADTQTAWALALGATRFQAPSYADDARVLARAVVEKEVGYDDTGRPVLAAGPFGTGGGGGRPVVAEPGYWTPPAEQVLAALTGDGRWRGMTTSHPAQLSALTRGGAVLPADWVRIGAGAGPTAIPAPSGGASVRCALDGQRTLVWASLDPATRPLAASWWRLIRSDADAVPLARSLDGRVLAADATPLGAAAAAAADVASRDRLLGRADELAARFPTYYGSAWLALGRLLLTTDRLHG